MTSSELHRKLLYCGYSEVTDYLRNSPMHRFLYKQLLVLRPKLKIDTSILTLFNELHYQCLKVQYDRNPGLDVKKRYIDEEAEWLGSMDAAELVFGMVLAMLKHKCELTFHDDCFISELEPLICDSRSKKLGEDFSVFIRQENVFVPYRFQPMPLNFHDLMMDFVTNNRYSIGFTGKIREMIQGSENRSNYVWRIVTENYSKPIIEDYLRLYPDIQYQKVLMQELDMSFIMCNKGLKLDYNEVFAHTKHDVEQGAYLTQADVACPSLTPHPTFDPDEDYDQMFGANFEQQVEEANNDLEEKYKEERDTLKQQLEQLKKSYEADLEHIEAKYQEEIAGLKLDLAKKAKEQTVKVPVEEPMTKELVMTISEIVDDAKEWFHESGASELTNMLYRFATRNHNMEDELWKQIESIIPAVEKRNATQVDINEAGQVNIGQKEVHNHTKE